MATRLGPRQAYVLDELYTWGPWPSRNELARAIGPHGSAYYGRQVLNRMFERGLIAIDPNHPDASPRGLGAVVMTDAGREAYLSYMKRRRSMST